MSFSNYFEWIDMIDTNDDSDDSISDYTILYDVELDDISSYDMINGK